MYCLKDLRKIKQLDFTREIVCGDCVQKLVGSSALPKKHTQKQPEGDSRQRLGINEGACTDHTGQKRPDHRDRQEPISKTFSTTFFYQGEF